MGFDEVWKQLPTTYRLHDFVKGCTAGSDVSARDSFLRSDKLNSLVTISRTLT